jgi:hypothetical protein
LLPEYFLIIYTLAIFVPEPPPANMNMNTSKKRKGLSDLEDNHDRGEAATTVATFPFKHWSNNT